jgi:hypothetical protein
MMRLGTETSALRAPRKAESMEGFAPAARSACVTVCVEVDNDAYVQVFLAAPYG